MFIIPHYWNNEKPLNSTALASYTEEKVTAGALGNCLKFTGQSMCSQLDVSISSLVSIAMAHTQSYLLFIPPAGWKGTSKECNASWFFFFFYYLEMQVWASQFLQFFKRNWNLNFYKNFSTFKHWQTIFLILRIIGQTKHIYKLSLTCS